MAIFHSYVSHYHRVDRKHHTVFLFLWFIPFVPPIAPHLSWHWQLYLRSGAGGGRGRHVALQLAQLTDDGVVEKEPWNVRGLRGVRGVRGAGSERRYGSAMIL